VRFFKNPQEINQFISHKKTIEQLLALELLDEFNKGDLINGVRAVAHGALDVIMDAPEALRIKALSEEKYLSVWNRGSLDMIYEEWNHLSASECSDIIRLYGCLVETGKDMVPKLKKGSAARQAAEKFVKEDKQKDLKRVGGGDRYPHGPKKVWDKDKYRRRGGALPPPEWLESIIGPAPFKGISIKAALNEGVLGKIENTFGLWKGAAISGTTADTIHVLNRFGNAGLDPIIFLLPVATIVYDYHHALIEVAMILTMNKIINYAIGSYTTLIPSNSKHPVKNVILSTFKRFENRKDNKLILIYYEKGKPAGCFQFEEAEKREFQKIATADISLWQYFASIGPYPTEADILKLLRQHGLEGKALQAVRKGFRQ
jgi:hypothetical protein